MMRLPKSPSAVSCCFALAIAALLLSNNHRNRNTAVDAWVVSLPITTRPFVTTKDTGTSPTQQQQQQQQRGRQLLHPSQQQQHLISQSTAIWMSSPSSALEVPTTTEDEDDEEEEFEYIEYELLEEQDLVGSEWLVGTNWDASPQRIEETWTRLAVSEDGQNVAVWGDGATGKWTLDVASQFLSISKENWLGKRIWACTVEDYYFLQGTVRGWTYLQSASVLGQWQAKRLGVEAEEAGTAPWFQQEQEQQESAVAASDSSTSSKESDEEKQIAQIEEQ